MDQLSKQAFQEFSDLLQIYYTVSDREPTADNLIYQAIIQEI